MTIDQLREIPQARPFKPFVLQLSDGSEVKVSHPECLAFHPKGNRTAIVALPNDGFKAIDVMLIAAIHVGNGKERRNKKKK